MEYIIKNISDKNVGILLSLLCGLRIGEVCALKWENIDLENKIIHITKTIQRIYIKENKKMIIFVCEGRNMTEGLAVLIIANVANAMKTIKAVTANKGKC